MNNILRDLFKLFICSTLFMIPFLKASAASLSFGVALPADSPTISLPPDNAIDDEIKQLDSDLPSENLDSLDFENSDYTAVEEPYELLISVKKQIQNKIINEGILDYITVLEPYADKNNSKYLVAGYKDKKLLGLVRIKIFRYFDLEPDTMSISNERKQSSINRILDLLSTDL